MPSHGCPICNVRGKSSSNARTFCDVFSVLLAVFSLRLQDAAPPLLDLRTVSCVAPALVEYMARYAARAPAMGPFSLEGDCSDCRGSTGHIFVAATGVHWVLVVSRPPDLKQCQYSPCSCEVSFRVQDSGSRFQGFMGLEV